MKFRRPGPTFSLAARHNQCRTDFGVPIRMSVGGRLWDRRGGRGGLTFVAFSPARPARRTRTQGCFLGGLGNTLGALQGRSGPSSLASARRRVGTAFARRQAAAETSPVARSGPLVPAGDDAARSTPGADTSRIASTSTASTAVGRRLALTRSPVQWAHHASAARSQRSSVSQLPRRSRHSATVSPWRWATFHSPPSRRYTCVARKV